MLKRLLAIMLTLFCLATPVYADDDTISSPTSTPAPAPRVEISADDGLTLVGDYHDPGGDGPALLLLHQMYTTRASWSAQIAPLTEAGFKVLAVDLRGMGATGGRINWTQAQADTLAWVAWLRAQPGVTSVALIGSSIGSSLALVGCAAAEGCAGAVALSPGLNYYQVATGDAVAQGFPVLIVYADRDLYPARDVPLMLKAAGEADGAGAHLTAWVYNGRAHGTDLFKGDSALLGQIIAWLRGE